MVRWIRHALVLTSVAFLAACGGGDDHPPAPVTLADTARNAGLTALNAAVAKAGLGPTLADPTQNLTVLAPTNAAFDALATQLGFAGAGALVDALPAATLQRILSYHVIAARTPSAALTAGRIDTLDRFDAAASRLTVSTAAGVAFTDAVLTTARVVQADVLASNGIVHVIDKVLVPPGLLTVVQTARVNPAFSSLVQSLVARDLVTPLSGAGPFTVFAPTNAAFDAVQSTLRTLTPAQVTTVLTYHVLPAQVLSAGIPFGTPVTTLATPRTITITAGPAPGAIASITDGTPTPARITAVDIRASNGVIHVIDKVLVPAGL